MNYLEPSPRARALMSGFFCQILTDEEEQELDRWIAYSNENMRIFEEWIEKEILDPSLSFINTADLDLLIKKPFFTPQMLRVAAFIGFIVITIGITWFDRGRDPIELIIAGERIKNRPNASRIQVTAPMGNPTLVMFPDSSTALLQERSTVSYPSFFPNYERRVRLNGRAEFHAKKEVRRWFRVHIQDYELISDGGKFTVESYDGIHSIRLKAIEGILKFKDGKHQWILDPGESATYSNKTWKKTP